jgi:hypothetical protein
MPENRDSILSLIDIANTLPDVCSSPCIVELQSLIKQGSGGVTFSATSSVTSEVLVGNKVTYNRLTATSSEIKVSDVTSQYDTTILTEEGKLKLSLGDESYAGITYSSIEARTADGGQTTEIYIKNHDNTYTYDKQITSQTENTTVSDGTDTSTQTMTPTDITSTSTSTTDISTITLANNNFSVGVSDIDGATSSFYFDANKENVNIGLENYTNQVNSLLALDPSKLSTSDGTYIKSYDQSGTSSIIQVNVDSILLSVIGGVNEPTIQIELEAISFKNIPAYDDDADAATGGLTTDNLYQTTGLGASPLDVAGILMIKQ